MNRLLVTLMLVLVFAFSFAKLVEAQTVTPGQTPNAPARVTRHVSHKTPPGAPDSTTPPVTPPPAALTVVTNPIPPADVCDVAHNCYRDTYTVNGKTYAIDLEIKDGKLIDTTTEADCHCEVKDLKPLDLPENIKAGTADSKKIFEAAIAQRKGDLKDLSQKERDRFERLQAAVDALIKECRATPESKVVIKDGKAHADIISFVKKVATKIRGKKKDDVDSIEASLGQSVDRDADDVNDPKMAQQECREAAMNDLNADDPEDKKVLAAIVKDSESEYIDLVGKAASGTLSDLDQKRLASLDAVHASVMNSGNTELMNIAAEIDARSYGNDVNAMQTQLQNVKQLAETNPALARQYLAQMTTANASLTVKHSLALAAMRQLATAAPSMFSSATADGQQKIAELSFISKPADLLSRLKAEDKRDAILEKKHPNGTNVASNDVFSDGSNPGSAAYKAASADAEKISRSVTEDANGNPVMGALTGSQWLEKYNQTNQNFAALTSSRPRFASMGSGVTAGLSNTQFNTTGFNNAAGSNLITSGLVNSNQTNFGTTANQFNSTGTTSRTLVSSSNGRPTT